MLTLIAKHAHAPEEAVKGILGQLAAYCFDRRIDLLSDDGIAYRIETVESVDGSIGWSTADGGLIATDSMAGIAEYLSADADSVLGRWAQLMIHDRKTPADIVRDYADWFRAA